MTQEPVAGGRLDQEGQHMVLLARRYDYLGGRLMSLCLALLAGRAVGQPVKLSWPISPLHGMSVKAEDVFSDTFLRTHLMTEAQVRAEDAETSDAYRLVTALKPNQMPTDLLVHPLPAFSEVLPPSSFSDQLRTACEKLTQSEYHAVHVRHGDLVRGNWRHFGHMDRFVPYDAVHHFISGNSHTGEIRVHSDEPEAARHLSEVSQAAGATEVRYVASAPLNGLAPDIFDIFNMAFAQHIIAPVNSAYSGFAALYMGRSKLPIHVRAMVCWAAEAAVAPHAHPDVAYSAKRHLFITEALYRNGLIRDHPGAVAKLLDHVEDTYPDTGELFSMRMKLFDAIPDGRSFDKLADLFVSTVERVSGPKMMQPSIVHMKQLTKDRGIAQHPKRVTALQHSIARAEAIFADRNAPR